MKQTNRVDNSHTTRMTCHIIYTVVNHHLYCADTDRKAHNGCSEDHSVHQIAEELLTMALSTVVYCYYQRHLLLATCMHNASTLVRVCLYFMCDTQSS